MLNDIFGTLNKLLNANEAPPSLPYPEEPPDFTLNISGPQLLQLFFNKYFIPEEHWNFWRSVTVVVDKTLSFPAGMVSETKTLYLKPEYANAGILAHEFSHLSYALLNQDQKNNFVPDYARALQTDGFLKLLSSQNQYMKTSVVEAHAEIFRYIGNKMPDYLNKYYPKLTS
jgi:hypothetical protein